ncbi:MAG: arsenite methyltransferase [Chloroflexota bacterium]
MTNASAEYFEQVAGEWDQIRSGYFTEAVRQAAIERAYLQREMAAADVGAGIGFVAAGLAPLVQQVYVLDGSAAMLAVAQRNLAQFDNIIYRQADGAALPLPDGSLDAVFANMYLHHTPDPLAAIREMARLLKPGGRLVITDMDAHPYAWMLSEMADVWQGFERAQVRDWFEQAGLVNVIVDCSGQCCHSQAQAAQVAGPDGRQAEVSIFVAVGTQRVAGARQAVQADYGAAALTETGCCIPGEGEACCGGESAMQLIQVDGQASGGGSCCGEAGGAGLIALESLDPLVDAAQINTQVAFNPNYAPDEQQDAPAEAGQLALGCGNPTALAGLQLGEVVLDIGSGAGLDAFLAARRVGPSGRVIGVDMTPEMIARARRGADKAGLAQVEFRLGQAEALPVEDASVDVVISNCVINLTEDKGLVFREALRVLKPGGRLEVSDMVTSGSFPPALRADPRGWPGCVFGALPEREYLDLAAQAGFVEIQAVRSASYGQGAGVEVYSLALSARRPE